MTLGLDLQGGSHILLQIDQQDLINDRLRGRRATTSAPLLRDARSAIPVFRAPDGLGAGAHPRRQAEVEKAKTALAKALTQPVVRLSDRRLGHRT
jgi:SecD/SecF fusion protein